MKIRHLVVLSAALMFAGNAFAEEGEALLKKNNCTMCHAVDKKIMGPALKLIAAKYSGNAAAQAKLEAKVRSGGKGSFEGFPAMPPQPAKVSDADIKAMVSWILTLK